MSARAGTTAQRDALLLTAGTLLSGVAAYAFIMIGTRSVGSSAFAPVSILWSLWAFTAAALTFPVQHWAIRTVEAAADETPAWSALPRITLLVLATSGMVLLVALVAGDHLYTESSLQFAVMTAALPLGSALNGVSRGILSARGRFGATAGVILGENAIRLLLVAIFRDSFGATGLGWALIAGFGIVAAFPSALVPRTHAPTTGSANRSMALLTGLSGAHVAAQTALTSAPVLLSLLGGAPRLVTELFAVLAVLRAPYMIAQGVSSRLTGPLTRSLRQAPIGPHTWTRRLGLVAAVTCAGAALLGPLLLPPITRVAFGLSLELPDLALGIVGAGSVLALANLGHVLVLVARGVTSVLWRSWALGLSMGLLALTLPTDAVLRVAVAFLVAEFVAFMAMGSVNWSRRPMHHRAQSTSSP